MQRVHPRGLVRPGGGGHNHQLPAGREVRTGMHACKQRGLEEAQAGRGWGLGFRKFVSRLRHQRTGSLAPLMDTIGEG